MKKDFKKELKEFYNPTSKNVTEANVPTMNFLMVDGMGDPTTSVEFKDAIEALYPLAYTIKFYFKKEKGIDYGVMPLEGLWWADDMNDFTAQKRDNWKWTLMIMQPDFVTKEIFEKFKAEVKAKKNPKNLDKIRLENYKEGNSAQIMHIGPFSEETANILKIHARIKELGKNFSGKHHEIYLSDMRRVDPKKMKTVVRQPFK